METGILESLAEAKISDKRTAVVSRFSTGESFTFTIGQRMPIKDAKTGKHTDIFIKGAVHVADVEGLKRLKKAISTAIETIEK